MDSTPAGPKGFKQMRDEVKQVVNSLELCWGCDRICECEEWLANEAVPVWLCAQCVSEAAYRLERQSGMPVSLLHV